MIALEHVFPARQLAQPKLKHDIENLIIGAFGAILLRAMPAILAAHLALMNEQWQWGLSFLLDVNLNTVAGIALTIIFLDFCIYWQHRYFHINTYLWRLHRVHHSDLNLSASSALRFHPFEIAVSMLVKSALVLLFGLPFVAVVLFEVALNAFALFNHTNLRLGRSFERWIRWLIVTPSMHRVHHSIELSDSNHNFGFCLSIWDRLFGSYRRAVLRGNRDFEMGVRELDSQQAHGTINLLLQPFIQAKATQENDARHP